MNNSTTAYEQLKAMGEACIDNTPQQVESLCGVTESEYDKGMRDCVKTIASQIGLTFCVDVGYADLPYKLAAYIADLRVDGQVDADSGEWESGDVCIYGGNTAAFIGFSPARKHLCVVEIYDYEGMSCVVKTVFVDELSKPESPQEKEKRERDEALNLIANNVFKRDWLGIHESDRHIISKLYDAGCIKGE